MKQKKDNSSPLSEKELKRLYPDYIPMSYHDRLKMIKEEEVWRQENSSVATGFMQIHRNKANKQKGVD